MSLLDDAKALVKESRDDSTEKLRKRIDAVVDGPKPKASAPKATKQEVDFFKPDPEREKKRKSGPPASMLGADAGELGSAWDATFSS